MVDIKEEFLEKLINMPEDEAKEEVKKMGYDYLVHTSNQLVATLFVSGRVKLLVEHGKVVSALEG